MMLVLALRGSSKGCGPVVQAPLTAGWCQREEGMRLGFHSPLAWAHSSCDTISGSKKKKKKKVSYVVLTILKRFFFKSWVYCSLVYTHIVLDFW